jgi:hypothetical protein
MKMDIVKWLRGHSPTLRIAMRLDEAANEIERLEKENKLLFDLFHEAVALPQGECPRPATAGDGMFNPQHKALGEKE